MNEDKQKILKDYVASSRAFADAVERLSRLTGDMEAFIWALDETGTAHRACEQSRIKLNKQMSKRDL